MRGFFSLSLNEQATKEKKQKNVARNKNSNNHDYLLIHLPKVILNLGIHFVCLLICLIFKTPAQGLVYFIMGIKTGPKRIAKSTGQPDRRQRDNKSTPGNIPSLKPHIHKKGD